MSGWCQPKSVRGVATAAICQADEQQLKLVHYRRLGSRLPPWPALLLRRAKILERNSLILESSALKREFSDSTGT
jgi:hypothetical protein